MRVLIADDDRVMRHALGRKLPPGISSLCRAATVSKCASVLQEPPLPAIALIDWNMPGVDGLTLCREIRNLPDGGNVYLILITSNASRQDVLSGLTSGADDYVVKPFDWEELRARVRIGARTASLQQTLAERVKELEARPAPPGSRRAPAHLLVLQSHPQRRELLGAARGICQQPQ